MRLRVCLSLYYWVCIAECLCLRTSLNLCLSDCAFACMCLSECLSVCLFVFGKVHGWLVRFLRV